MHFLMPSRSERGRAPWIALVVLLALAGGLGVAVTQWRPTRSHSPVNPDNVPAPSDTGEDVIRDALGQVPVDSVALKHRWLDEVPGIDVSMLTAPERDLFVRAANSEPCTCGCGYTLATCRAYDTECPVSGPRVQALRDSVQAGLVQVKGLRERPTGTPIAG